MNRDRPAHSRVARLSYDAGSRQAAVSTAHDGHAAPLLTLPWPTGVAIDVRAHHFRIGTAMGTYVRDRVMRRLGKYSAHITRVMARFEDVNGPKGGLDVACSLQVFLRGAPALVVHQSANSAREAFDQALDAVAHAARQNLERRGRMSKQHRHERRGGRANRDAGAQELWAADGNRAAQMP